MKKSKEAAHIHPYVKQRRFKFSAGGISYLPPRLAAFYGFPTGFDGSGRKVAVIELGGGYVQSELDGYFQGLELKVKPVVFHSIAGAKNDPSDEGASLEVMLDLCVIGGMAPGVEMHCYMAPNSDAGFLEAIQQAVADRATVICICWGMREDAWKPATMQKFNAAFQQAGDAGITVVVAAGDNGSGDGEAGDHVDFPASSPYVLACGGTSLLSTAPIQEVVWNDGTVGGATGGGTSAFFPLPSWQAPANVPGGKARGVPDVAGDADPDTGWLITAGGSTMVVGGTSAVAPMWAALVAVLSQALGRNLGFLNPQLYALTGWDRDIITGNNGTFVARPGYDCCTGLGVPNGAKLLAALSTEGQPVAPPPPPPATGVIRTIVVTGAESITVDGQLI